MSVFTDTFDRREWEQGRGLRGQGADNEDGGGVTKAGAINHLSDAFTHS